MFKKYYKYGVFLGIIIFLILLINTNTGKNYINYIKNSFDSNYEELTKTYEAEKIKYNTEIETHKALYQELEKDKRKLIIERDNLKIKSDQLAVELKKIQERKKTLIAPKDIYEASKILNDIGFSNTIMKCQWSIRNSL